MKILWLGHRLFANYSVSRGVCSVKLRLLPVYEALQLS